MSRKILSLSLLVLTIGCSNRLSDPAFPTGSQTVIASADQKSLYVVDTDEGLLLVQNIASGEITSVEVGKEPTRVARANGRVFVSLRAEGALAVLKENSSGSLSLEQKVLVGTEPYGVVASEDGKKIFVALSTQNEVVELDGKSFTVVQSWKIENQPSWLALTPSGEALYVACAMQGGLHWIDLKTGDKEKISLSSHTGAGEDAVDNLTFRITGDPWISSDGRLLTVPALYVDNITPVEEPDEGEVSGGYASSPSLVVSRFNPAIEMIPLDGVGKPELNEATSVFAAGFGLDDTVRSYLSSVVIAPDGNRMIATMEASNVAILLSTTPIYEDASADTFDTGFFDSGNRSIGSGAAGFTSAASVVATVDGGPRGAVFVGEEAYIHSFIDRSVGPLWLESADRLLSAQYASGETSAVAMASPRGFSMGPSTLDPNAESGRNLFYSATLPQMAASGAGVSCSTCHFDARNDGLTWAFTTGDRQTPSLAGQVLHTAPVTWTANVDSVASEATITSQGRMGGDELTYTQALQIQSFAGSIRPPILPLQGSEDPAVVRGQAIFEREDVACASCHDPANTFQDGASHKMFGLDNVNTPTLVGVGATAPYLHNGRAETLMDVLELSRSGEMGNTSSLSEEEMADLEAYLLSL